jgi:ribonuclease Y
MVEIIVGALVAAGLLGAAYLLSHGRASAAGNGSSPAELERADQRAQAREAALDRRAAELEKRAAELEQREAALIREREETDAVRADATRALERASGLSAGQAKQALLKEIEDQARHDSVRIIRRSRRRPSATPSAACARSSVSRCSGSPPATRPRRPCRSCSCPATT